MRFSVRRSALFSLAALVAIATPLTARADDTPTGAPPADAKASFDAPKAPGDAPSMEKKLDGTNLTASAGGQLVTGNSNFLALTGNVQWDMRKDKNGFGAGVLGNYGQSGSPVLETVGNIQARARYDRYILDQMSLFLLNTVRNDRFQGIDFRYNLDPGVKYLFIAEADRSFWGEAGYDFQYTVVTNAARVQLDDSGKPAVDSAGNSLPLLDKTDTDHSARLFMGYKYSFNKDVTAGVGVEYLQSVITSSNWRINADALIAAKLGFGLSVGFGFSAKYNHNPIGFNPVTEAPLQELDTTTTMSLIYSFSDVPTPPKPCDCVPPPEQMSAPPPATPPPGEPAPSQNPPPAP